MMKFCRKCGENRELSEFHKDRSKKDGLSSCCNSCAKEYRLRTKHSRQERWSTYYAEHEELLRTKRKERYSVKAEKEKEYREKNRGKAAERERKRRAEDLRFCVSKRLRKRVREVVRRISGGGVPKSAKTELLLGCSFSTLMLHLGVPTSKNAHIDHICPLAQAKTVEEVEALCHYLNLRWAEPTENIQKGAKRTEEGERLCLLLLGREWE